jgi:predicted permease
MGEWLREVRYAIRILSRAPGFTLVAILSLALGIGANTAVFTVVHATLMEPLPVGAPHELRLAYWRTGTGFRNIRQMNSDQYLDPASGQRYNSNYSYAIYRAFADAAGDSAAVFAFTFLRSANVAIDGNPTVAGGMLVSGNYFRSLRVPMAMGREIRPEDDRPSAEQAVVLSHRFWRRAFGADPSAIGRSIRINGQPFVIVGVTGADYYGVSQGGFFPPADLTISLAMQPVVLPQWNRGGESVFTSDSTLWLRVMVRPAPGVDVSALERTFATVLAEHPPFATGGDGGVPINVAFSLVPARRGLDSLRRDFERPLYILAGVVGIVFLIACVNLASLMLARGVARHQEMWIRLSLGAGRLRIIRQTLIESLLLALAGGVAGVALAVVGGRALVAMLAESRPVAAEVPLDLRLLVIAVTVSCVAGLLFGLFPAIRLARGTSAYVRPAGVGATAPRLAAGRWLVAVQIAVSLPLLIGSALFLRTIYNLGRVDLGFNPNGLVVFRLDPTLNAYSPDRMLAFYQRTLERLEGVPGVASAALMDNALVSGITSSSQVSVDGGQPRSILWNHVSAGFFETMGMHVVAGRALGLQDGPNAPRVAVVNEAAARALFNGAALGRRFTLSGFGQATEYEVVGIAPDSKYESLRRASAPTLYMSYQQSFLPGAMHVAVRTSGSPAIPELLRAAVADVDRDIPISGLKSQTAQIDETIARERVFTLLLTFFGGFALLLACIGLHGVTAYAVARRTSEIGIRMALGAQRRSVIWLVLRQVVVLAVVGLVVGIPASVAAARSVSAFLYDVQPTDAFSITVGAVVMFCVAIGSGFFPARRASLMDPLKALRAE